MEESKELDGQTITVIAHAANPGEPGKWWWFRNDFIVMACPLCGSHFRVAPEPGEVEARCPNIWCAYSAIVRLTE
jgi:hypothetical protein